MVHHLCRVLAKMVVPALLSPLTFATDAPPTSYTLPCLHTGSAGAAHVLFVSTDFGVCLRIELWACFSIPRDGSRLLDDGARGASGID